MARKSAAQLSSEVAEFLAGEGPLTTRQAKYLKHRIEAESGGTVTIGELGDWGGHRITIEHKPSGHRETFGVSKYGIAPSEVRFGSGHAEGSKEFRAALKSALAHAKKMK